MTVDQRNIARKPLCDIGAFESSFVRVTSTPTPTPTLTPSSTPTITLTPSQTFTRTPKPTKTPCGTATSAAGISPDTGMCLRNPTDTPTPLTSCPWNGIAGYAIDKSLYSCTYNYDREQAYQYALAYAARANPLFCQYEYLGTRTPVGDCGNATETDCANFISQAILDGGFVMTTAEGSSGETDRWYVILDGLNLYEHDHNDQNWAGALSSQLPQYIVNLGGIELGPGTPYFNTLVPPNPTVFSVLTPPFPTVNPTTTAEIGNVVSMDATLDSPAYQIQKGDILFLDGAGHSLAHTAFIAGWGEALTSWSQLTSTLPVFSTRGEAVSNGVKNPVPYVLDHGTDGVLAADPNGLSPFINPRPYYMLWWPVPTDGGHLFYPIQNGINISFIHLPDVIVFVVNPNGVPASSPTPIHTPNPGTPAYMPTPRFVPTYLPIEPTDLNPAQLFDGHR